DFSIESRTTHIASFRAGMPVLVAATTFSDFVRWPKEHSPAEFAAAGKLRDALEFAKSQNPFPFPKAQKPMRFAINDDQRTAEIVYADREVRLCCAEGDCSCEGECGRLENFQVRLNGVWSDIAEMLLLKKKADEFLGVANWLTGPRAPAKLPVLKPVPRTETAESKESPLAFAAAAEKPDQAATGVKTAATPAAKPATARKPAGAGPIVRAPVRSAGHQLSPREMMRRESQRPRR
ncbi:MAG TPA: hypothetical protein VNC50_10925, partial [Planctomycetia bacterium]|nr:hypothetical protein [Planctomycetia bacterium]